MKITRTDECPCRLHVDDLKPGDVFKFNSPAEAADDLFMVVIRPPLPPEYRSFHRGRPPFSRRTIVCLNNGRSCGRFPEKMQRNITKMCAELVVAEDES